MIIENLPIGRNVVHLSKYVRSDASSLVYGTTAPTGADPTARIQAVIDRVPTGGTLVWDIAVGISEPIYIPSNITIHAPGREFGAILRAESNCPMFRNAGIATDSTTNKQKTFGKLDPAHAGDQRYRVLDPVNFMNDRNITISGGTWNGNRQEQTGYPFTEWGFGSVFQFWGVENLLVENILILKPRAALPFHLINWYKVRIVGCEVDCSPITEEIGGVDTMAAFQIQGPGRFLSMIDPITHASDDHIALNCDDTIADQINNTYAGGESKCAPGVNWTQCGDITDVHISNHQISDGAEGVVSTGCMRMLSTVHTVDRVVIDGQSGRTKGFGYTIGAIAGCQINGVGNIGSVDFLNCSVELEEPVGGFVGKGLFEIQSNVKQIRILNRKRGAVPSAGVCDVYVGNPTTGTSTVQNLILTGDYYDDSISPVAMPQVHVASRVNRLAIDTRRSQLVTTAADSPVLRTGVGAEIGFFEFFGGSEYATNIVKHAAGEIATVMLHGSHRLSGGGSPMDIASTLEVKNYWYKDLAFATGIAAKSGAGTVTNDNDYAEPVVTVRNLSLFDGASSNLDVYTPDTGGGWTLAGISATSKPVSSGGTLTIPSMVAPQESLIVCDGTAANGIITIQDVAGWDLNTGIGVLFYWTDSSNYVQFIFDPPNDDLYWYKIKSGAVDAWQVVDCPFPETISEIRVSVGPTYTRVFLNGALTTELATSIFEEMNSGTQHGLKTFPIGTGSGTTTPLTVSSFQFVTEE